MRLSSYWWLVAALLLSPSLHPAHAYLDPNTGSYAIQIAIGFIFGAFYAFKGFVARTAAGARAFFKRHRKDDQS